MSDPLARLTELEGVASAYAATRDGFDALLRDRGLRKTKPELTSRSLLLGAHASAVLDGSSLTLEQVTEGELDDVVRAALRISAELLGLAPTVDRAPLQVLARLHAVAGVGVVAEADLGRPVQGAPRLAALAELLTSPTKAPAMVVAAIAHAEVRAIAPFGSHNGMVARAFERLLLVQRGVDPTSLTVPEIGHLENRAAYESNLRGYTEGGLPGVHSWLLYAAEAYTSGANASPVTTA